MWLSLLGLCALASDVQATPKTIPVQALLTWSKHGAWLRVAAEEGFKVAPDAPATVVVGWEGHARTFEVDGAGLVAGQSLGQIGPRPVTGELTVGVCDVSGSCQPMSFQWQAAIASKPKSGAVICQLEPMQQGKHHGASPFGPDASLTAVEEAFAQAKVDGQPVMLDFSAAWCPPCNLLAAEVLHADPAEPALEDVHVAVIDVDHPSSWALKEKYDVGGYPTIVVVNPDGAERSRTVGYEDKDAFLDWLAAAKTSNDAVDIQKGPEGVSAARAGELALYLAQQREFKAAKPFLAKAQTEEMQTPGLLAALIIEPTTALMQRVLDVEPTSWKELGGGALQLGDEAKAFHEQILTLANRHATPEQLPDVLYLQAHFSPEPERPIVFGQAAIAVRGLFVQDPSVDRAYVDWLASLYRDAGQPSDAEALLKTFAGHFPDEPTFYTSLARHYLTTEQPKLAIEASDQALAVAWGDSLLTAATQKVKGHLALGQQAQAEQVVKEALASVPEPEEKVRTSIYRKRLAKLVEPSDAPE